jgi:hypothetical protein
MWIDPGHFVSRKEDLCLEPHPSSCSITDTASMFASVVAAWEMSGVATMRRETVLSWRSS